MRAFRNSWESHSPDCTWVYVVTMACSSCYLRMTLEQPGSSSLLPRNPERRPQAHDERGLSRHMKSGCKCFKINCSYPCSLDKARSQSRAMPMAAHGSQARKCFAGAGGTRQSEVTNTGSHPAYTVPSSFPVSTGAHHYPLGKTGNRDSGKPRESSKISHQVDGRAGTWTRTSDPLSSLPFTSENSPALRGNRDLAGGVSLVTATRWEKLRH